VWGAVVPASASGPPGGNCTEDGTDLSTAWLYGPGVCDATIVVSSSGACQSLPT
jgi:hypothetical protein